MSILSLTDFEDSNWQNVISEVTYRTCWNYHSLFLDQAKIEHTAKNEIAEQVFTRLALWTTPPIGGEANVPFPEVFLNLISNDDFKLLRILAPATKDEVLKARLADIAWQGRVDKKRDPQMARLAIPSYLEISKSCRGHWREEAASIDRALLLSFEIGREAPEQEIVLQHIESRLQSINGDDDWFISAHLMEHLQRYKRGNATIYAPMAETAALKAENARGVGQWSKARRYWEVKAAWHDRGNEEGLEALRRSAETHAAEAQDEIDAFYGRQELISAALHLQKAIEAYRNISSYNRFKTRIDELHQLMIEINTRAHAEFEKHAYTIDISNHAKNATEWVKGLSFAEAMRSVVLMHDPPPKETLREHVEQSTNEIGEVLCLFQTVSSNGQVISQRPSLFSNTPEEREKALEFEMFSVAGRYHNLFVEGFLLPALSQIRQEHKISTSDWVSLIHHSPFVPIDRELLFAWGFQAGWNGDWDIAVHLLVPQVENSVRHILTNNGFLSSAMSPAGIQSEKGLDQTLKDPSLLKVLPEALIFDMRGLLIEKSGSYLRHKMCHGLVSSSHFYSSPSLYLWWLTLRLCLFPLLSLKEVTNEAVAASDNMTFTDAESSQVPVP